MVIWLKKEALAVKSATQTQVIVWFFFGACRIEALLDHIILPTKQKRSVYRSIAKIHLPDLQSAVSTGQSL